MIRSTPSSSGSGNITPASTTIVVSPQATTIMFMPNSPRPPSGIRLERRESAVDRARQSPVKAPHIRVRHPAGTTSRVDRPSTSRGHDPRGEPPGRAEPASMRRSAAIVCPPGAAGTADQGLRKIAQTIAQLSREAVAKNSASRANSVSCSVSGRRDRIDARARQRLARIAPRGRRRTGRSAFASVLRRCMNIARTSALERRLVGDRDGRWPEPQPNDRRMHLGRGPERARRQRQQRPHVGVQLHEDGEHAVVARPRRARAAGPRPRAAASASRRRSAADAASARCSANRIGEDDVVRKVAGDAEAARRDGSDARDRTRGSRPERASRSAAACGAQRGGQIAIDLDGGDAARPAAPAGASARRGPGRSRETRRRAAGRSPRPACRPTPARGSAVRSASSAACDQVGRPVTPRRATRRASTSPRSPRSPLRSSRSSGRTRGSASRRRSRGSRRRPRSVVLDRPLEDRDAIGQRVAVGPAALGQRRALIEAEERVRRLDLHLVEQVAATARPRRRPRCSSSPRGTPRDLRRAPQRRAG